VKVDDKDFHVFSFPKILHLKCIMSVDGVVVAHSSLQDTTHPVLNAYGVLIVNFSSPQTNSFSTLIDSPNPDMCNQTLQISTHGDGISNYAVIHRMT
jgi:hypothetical protein